ncbi:MAG: hypothetical protein LUI10_13830 [Lachnospiraceae bacterium]|nr:hypothetical protein [Lachnospiraceae bacterium]
MDCFQILLLFLLASCCSGTQTTCRRTCFCGCTNSCSIAEQSCTCTEPADADCSCQALAPPDTVIAYGQTTSYPFAPYPVLRE